MQSQCPKCKKQVEHEDFLFEVHCDCGCRFNPFMGLTEVPPLDGVEPSPELEQIALDPSPAQAPANEPLPDFSESQSVFNELKEFAEGTVANPEELAAAAQAAPPAIASMDLPADPFSGAEAPTPAAPVAPVEGALPMTAGDQLCGFRIQSYLTPVSVVSALGAQGANPLKAGFEALGEQAKALGANAVIAVRWGLAPDGVRVIFSGTPVQVTKGS